jgi:hypothetical protein
MFEMPSNKKLTVSHVNKKLDDYHGEIKSKQQTLIEWILKELRRKEKERQDMEERLQREKSEQVMEQYELGERIRKQRRKESPRSVPYRTKIIEEI